MTICICTFRYCNMISVWQLGGLLVLVYPVLYALRLIYNYRKATLIGLPVLCTPIDPSNVLWMICANWLEPTLRVCLPRGWVDFVEYNSRDWNYDKIYQLQQQVGDTFVIVSPKQIRVFTANAKAANDLTRRRGEFPKAIALYTPLEIFGRNVVTTEGGDWVRHRKITSSPFNERNSALVWNESKRQAMQMLAVWVSKDEGVVNLQSDTMMLALHVLTGAGFGRFYSFGKGLEAPSEGHSMIYRDCLSIILGNLFTAVFTATIAVPSWLLPPKLKLIQDAIHNFRLYMAEMVEEERIARTSDGLERDTLLSMLVRASEASRDDSKGGRYLTDSEIFGNLFSYNLAGHETTSNTLAYAVILLAGNPQWQDWVGEEVEAVANGIDVQDFEYESTYPRLSRTLAIMYETLRLYGAARAVPKTTVTPQTLSVNDRIYSIPSNTFVGVNLAGLHINPAIWGPQALEWQPDRWIEKDEKGIETIISLPAGAFMPWASGPRICPGKKFSQVEFVAVIACLLRHHRVQAVCEPGEISAAVAAARLNDEVKQSSFSFLLKVKRPQKIRVRWVRN